MYVPSRIDYLGSIRFSVGLCGSSRVMRCKGTVDRLVYIVMYNVNKTKKERVNHHEKL